jgi:hypothetical protein
MKTEKHCEPELAVKLLFHVLRGFMEDLMRLVLFSLSALLFCSASADAKLFEELQPIGHWFNSTPSLNLHGDACGQSTCDGCAPTCRRGPAPNMIGDSLGVPHYVWDEEDSGITNVILYPNYYAKVADNNSAVPQDRVYINYRFFNDVDTYKDPSGIVGDEARDLSIIELGIEKTFFDGLVSAEFILPLANTPDNDFSSFDGIGTPEQHMKIQNIAFGAKFLLIDDVDSAFSLGLRVQAPTTDGIQDQVNPEYYVTFESWSITPYLAYLQEINQKTFVKLLPHIVSKRVNIRMKRLVLDTDTENPAI